MNDAQYEAFLQKHRRQQTGDAPSDLESAQERLIDSLEANLQRADTQIQQLNTHVGLLTETNTALMKIRELLQEHVDLLQQIVATQQQTIDRFETWLSSRRQQVQGASDVPDALIVSSGQPIAVPAVDAEAS